ncbi:translation initiation factor 2A [Pancytospora epiphaga]|nr:translation initiation factor 2A [Pancytospora epiphaga]
MPVVALTEKGLIIDVFGQNPFIKKCQEYKCSGKHIVAIQGKVASFMDFFEPQNSVENTISGYADMKLSKDGTKVAILEYGKRMSVYENRVKVAVFEGVEAFSISNEICAFSTMKGTHIHSFLSNTISYQSDRLAKAIYCVGSVVIAVIKQTEYSEVIVIKEKEVYQALEHKNIHGTSLEISDDGSRCLFSVEVEYAKSSYYADAVLYLFVFSNRDPESCKCTLSSGDKQVPEVVVSNEIFTLCSYSTLKKVSCFRFLGNNSFYVCFGLQPACLHLYSNDGYFLKRYPKVIRNKVHFSRDGSRIINAGLGNLPGNIEVFCGDTTTCKFESLGASVVEWLNDDTHFIVATTNYFKSDNRIKVYDYYGRAVDVLECENLVAVNVYGEKECQKVLSPPQDNAVNTKVTGYVPPHMRGRNVVSMRSDTKKPLVNGKKPFLNAKKLPPLNNSSSQRSKEDVEKELYECMELKKRLASGEDLCLEDQNRIFRITQLKEELSKY